MAPAQGVEQHLPRAVLVRVWLSHTCPGSHLSTLWGHEWHRHNTQHSFALILGTQQKRGVSSNENRDFPQPAWMSQPVTSLGIPKMCNVKKIPSPNRAHFLFFSY